MTKNKVSLFKCNSYDEKVVAEAVRKLLEPLGTITEFVRPGDSVLIKPNMLSCREPEKVATTHPEVVKQLALICLDAGASKVIIGDSPPAIFGKADSFWEKTGFKKVAESCGAQLVAFENEIKKNIKFSSNGLEIELPVAGAYFSADVVINLCKMKTHNLTRLTGAMKNLFGLVPGLQKAYWHKVFPSAKLFGYFIADMAMKLPCSLHIMDGIVAMHGPGPASGQPYPANLLIASKSPVAIDHVFCKLAKIKSNTLSSLVRASQIGWGPKSINEIDCIYEESVESLSFNNFKVPYLYILADLVPSKLSSIVARFIHAQPILETEKCIACSKCVAVCPAKAIKIAGNKAVFNYKTCISCFCCMEVCPFDAISIRQSSVLKIASNLKEIKKRIKRRT